MVRVWARLSKECDESASFLGDETALAGNDPTQVMESLAQLPHVTKSI